MNKLFTVALTMLLFLSTVQVCLCQTAPQISSDWQIKEDNGYYEVNGDGLHLWSTGGSDHVGITFWKQIQPTGDDFSFSVKVNANNSESCAIFVRDRPEARTAEGFNFEFGHYGRNVFLLARNFNGWVTSQVAMGEAHVWYTMQLDVSNSPFLITTTVLDENGNVIGSVTTSEIEFFSFEDMKYVGIGVWGYSPSDYTFRDIEGLREPEQTQTENQQIFDLESNSTITGVVFDDQTATLSFTVSGPTNTTGYVKATIDKNLVAKGENLKVNLDDKPLPYTVTLEGNTWVYVFYYSHSTHRINMYTEPEATPTVNSQAGVASVAVFAVAVAGGLGIFFVRRSHNAAAA